MPESFNPDRHHGNIIGEGTVTKIAYFLKGIPDQFIRGLMNLEYVFQAFRAKLTAIVFGFG